MTDKKEVTQEDRQRAADYYGQFGEFSDLSQACSEGLTDGADFGLVQAFAAHRIAAEQKAKAHWLEEAAKVAQQVANNTGKDGDDHIELGALRCRDAIRSLGEHE